MNGDIEGIEYLAERLIPTDTIRVYNKFIDNYRQKHLISLLETYSSGKHAEWLKKRGETFKRYCKIYYNDQAIINRYVK